MADPYPQTSPTAYMTVAEFVDAGLLQEVNRLFFHPRGLALEVDIAASPDTGVPYRFVAGIWDERGDEPMRYADGVINPAKVASAAAMVRNDPQPVPPEGERHPS